MSSVLRVNIGNIQDGPYRTTWRYQDNRRPQAFDHIFRSLQEIAMTGHELTIHVYQSGSAVFTVLDGHIALDVYRAFGRESIPVILHENTHSEEQALAFYIAANYLRCEGWLRSGVKLRDLLAKLGENRAALLMADPDLAKDLVNRNQVKWDTYSTGFVDPNDNENHEDQLLG